MMGYRDFAALVGTEFVARHAAGDTTVVLDECRPHGDHAAPSSFGLTFRAAPDFPAEQGTYELSAEGIESALVFMVPIGTVAGDSRFATVFEAIFTTTRTPPGGS